MHKHGSFLSKKKVIDYHNGTMLSRARHGHAASIIVKKVKKPAPSSFNKINSLLEGWVSDRWVMAVNKAGMGAIYKKEIQGYLARDLVREHESGPWHVVNKCRYKWTIVHAEVGPTCPTSHAKVSAKYGDNGDDIVDLNRQDIPIEFLSNGIYTFKHQDATFKEGNCFPAMLTVYYCDKKLGVLMPEHLSLRNIGSSNNAVNDTSSGDDDDIVTAAIPLSSHAFVVIEIVTHLEFGWVFFDDAPPDHPNLHLIINGWMLLINKTSKKVAIYRLAKGYMNVDSFMIYTMDHLLDFCYGIEFKEPLHI